MTDKPLVIERRGRAAGTTYKQLEALPDGGIYLVSHHAMADHCRMILKTQGRRPDAVKLISLEGARDGVLRVLRGLSRDTAVDIDHHARENMTRRQWDEVTAFTARLDRPLPDIKWVWR